MRLAPVMLALLLALSPGAVAVQTAAPIDGSTSTTTPLESRATVQTENQNTPATLTLGKEPQRKSFETPPVSLSDSLAANRNKVETDLTIGTFARQFQTVKSRADKQQLLNRFRYQIENKIISIESREQRASRAFNNGSITSREYARTLGQIDIQAEHLQQQINAMRERANSVSRFNMDSEADTLQGKLVTLEGPVRDRIGKTMQGRATSTNIYIATAESGVVLATITDSTYIREVTRYDLRNPGAKDEVSGSLTESRDMINDHYPWATNHTSGSRASLFGTTNVYREIKSHTQGELTAYLDGGTEAIFREIQHKHLRPQLLTGPTVRNSTEDLTLNVNRTYPGGPLRVELLNATGAPLDGTVTVAGEEIGRTGSDGILWTLGPTRQFQVSATHDFTTVNVTTRPTQPQVVYPNNSTNSTTAMRT